MDNLKKSIEPKLIKRKAIRFMSNSLKPIGAFKILHSPKYLADSETLDEKTLQYASNSQGTIWESIVFFLQNNQEINAAELRYIYIRQTRTVTPYLIFFKRQIRNSSPTTQIPFSNIQNMFSGILPNHYGWSYIPENNITECSPSHCNPNWATSYVQRRLLMFEIPSKLELHLNSGLPINDNSNKTSTTPTNSDNTQTYNIKRRFPLPFDQIGIQTFVVPYVRQLDDSSYFSEEVFSDLLGRDDAIIRFCFTLPDQDLLKQHRNTAATFERFIRPFFPILKQSLGNSHESISSMYNKFWLPTSQNIVLQISCVAKNISDSIGILQSIVAPFGGLSLFEIRSKENSNSDFNFVPIEDSVKKTINNTDIFRALESEYDIDMSYFNNIGIEIANKIASFIRCFRYYYTLNEMASILKLPYTFKNGLPGLTTKPVVPFSNNTKGFQGSDYAPSKNEIRLGFVSNLSCEKTNDQSSANNIVDSGNWNILEIDELAKHAFITGSTGSGKSNFMKWILKELTRANLPFMIIEPVKSEYYPFLTKGDPSQKVKLFHFDGSRKNEGFFAFDPMVVPPKTSVATHISYLKGVFQSAFPLEPVASLILENGIVAYYVNYLGFDIFLKGSELKISFMNCADEIDSENDISTTFENSFSTNKLYYGIYRNPKFPIVHPSVEGFANFFLESFLSTDNSSNGSRPDTFMAEIKQIYKRRFSNLIKGPIGYSFELFSQLIRQNYNPNLDISKQGLSGDNLLAFLDAFSNNILNENVIMELETIGDDEQKSMVMTFLLTYIFEFRQGNGNAKDINGRKIKHLLVIEEAHRLLSNSSIHTMGKDGTNGPSASSNSINLFCNMLAEIRSYGQGLVVIDQIPSKIASDILKNTNLKVMLRLNSSEDRKYLAAAMGFDSKQEEFVSMLSFPQAIIFNSSIDQPILLNIPNLFTIC